jgi:hypothetical protein
MILLRRKPSNRSIFNGLAISSRCSKKHFVPCKGHVRHTYICYTNILRNTKKDEGCLTKNQTSHESNSSHVTCL